MSMLSAQCDELRAMAESVGLAMPQAATLMMGAADTIWELREKLTASPQCETCEAMLDCDECLRADESAKERKRLDYENAKLRELVKEAHLCMVNEGCCEDCYATHGECPIERDMREMKIEVSE